VFSLRSRFYPYRMSEEKLPVLSIVHDSGPFGTVPELLFEKNGLIPALQQMLVSIRGLFR
jgi:hypothetical protein